MKIIAKINEGSDIINAEYLKTELGKIRHFLVVDELPELSKADLNTVYLLKKGGSPVEESDIYDEWVCTQKGDDTSTRAWELLGDTKINLDNYYTKEEVDEKIGEAANVNEETFIFKNDLTTTTGVGKYPAATTGYTTIPAKGQTFKQVWNDIFNEELNPETVNPTLTLSVNNSVKDPDKYEAGTKVNFNITSTFDEGSYSYDDSTEVTAGTYTIKFNGTTYSTSSVSISQYQFTDSANNITGNVTYSDGIIPHTNIGNEYNDGQIKAGAATANSVSVKAGYRNIFYGLSDNDFAYYVENPDKLRELPKSSISKAKTLDTYAVEKDAAPYIIVAMPSSRSISKVTMPSTQDIVVTPQFELQDETVLVHGANGYTAIAYKVYVFAPDEMKGDYKIVIS